MASSVLHLFPWVFLFSAPYWQVFYNRVLAWAGDPALSSVSVKSLIDQRNALVLLCPAPVPGSSRDEFVYSWLTRRMDSTIALVEAARGSTQV